MAKRKGSDPGDDVSPARETLPSPEPQVTQNQTHEGHRARGYIPDTDEMRAKHASHLSLVGAPARVPTEAMGLVPFAGQALDQYFSSACVGEAVKKALNVFLASRGTPVPEFSGLGMYTLGRACARRVPKEPIYDIGSQPSFIMMALSEWGIPFESKWPFDIVEHPEHLNQDLPVDVLEDSITHCVNGTFRINSEGDDRLNGIRHALSQGYPVIFGTYVSDDFQTYTGDALRPTLDPETKRGGGGHMLCILGYSGDRFYGINSWGESWGLGGFFWCSEDFLRDERADDFYVVTAGPKG